AVKLLEPVLTKAQSESLRFQSVNNLKQIGLAFHNYHSEHRHFPAAVLYGGKDRKIPYSWRVALLPYLEQQDLYRQYDFNESWDGPNNSKLLDKMPATYAYPNLGGMPSSRTHPAYFVFTGTGPALATSLRGDSMVQPSLEQFNDGSHLTILAVE